MRQMTPDARACNEGRSWARREWRATAGTKRGKWRGTVAEALAVAISVHLAVVLNAAAAEEWERLRREARI